VENSLKYIFKDFKKKSLLFVAWIEDLFVSCHWRSCHFCHTWHNCCLSLIHTTCAHRPFSRDVFTVC